MAQRNNTPASVRVFHIAQEWFVGILAADHQCVIAEDGEPEISTPHPKNRGKTVAVAVRLAKAHDVPGYIRERNIPGLQHIKGTRKP